MTTRCPFGDPERANDQFSGGKRQGDKQQGNGNLETAREVSSIPRLNDGQEDSRWIYPSERMFFDAMKRKDWDPKEADMKSIIPIHNAVNERAWHEIVKWEQGYGSDRCGGPKLVTFQGDASKLTPKARMLSLVGYQKPFDRHDWTIDRCGQKIEYVIDFYHGRSKNPTDISLYLDVRPKISWEGLRMRFGKLFTD